eukprot:13979099-Alexandrium_andersonii.AAC.1
MLFACEVPELRFITVFRKHPARLGPQCSPEGRRGRGRTVGTHRLWRQTWPPSAPQRGCAVGGGRSAYN